MHAIKDLSVQDAVAAYSKNALPQLYAGSYLLVFAFGALSAIILAIWYKSDEPSPTPVHVAVSDEKPRSVMTVMSQPISLAAIANNVIGGVVMIMVMTAAPLAAVNCGQTVEDGANVIQWHLVGMFAPSLFAGQLIKRIGLTRVLYVGMFLSAACAAVAIHSTSITSFYVALLLLGVGWNFMFVGGTLLLAESYRPSERAAVQGSAEALRGALTAIAALSTGPLLQHVGWSGINFAVFPLIAMAAAMTFVWRRSQLRAVNTVLG